MRTPLVRLAGQSSPDPQEAERGTNANDRRSFNWGRGSRDGRAGRQRFFSCRRSAMRDGRALAFLQMTNDGLALRQRALRFSMTRFRRACADARLTRRKNIPHHRNRCSAPWSIFRPRGIAGFQSSVSSIRLRGIPELSVREYASSIFETRPRDDVGAKAAASATRRARRAAD